MIVDFTAILSSAVTASIIGVSQFMSIRYASRLLDRIEKKRKQEDKTEAGDSDKKPPA